MIVDELTYLDVVCVKESHSLGFFFKYVTMEFASYKRNFYNQWCMTRYLWMSYYDSQGLLQNNLLRRGEQKEMG